MKTQNTTCQNSFLLKSTRYLLLFILFITATVTIRAQSHKKREMRAVWITTAYAIDWPSDRNSVDNQKRELIEIIDRFEKLNFNTIVFQVRPAADAFYHSDTEPWSQWLMGKQGKAPEPFYDPLQFVTEECRKKGLDIHVWLNPYRAATNISGSTTSENHITKKHPEWFIDYGNTKYFNPGLPEVRNYFAALVSDIIRRYDIDAIHLDDYFYPYRLETEFPDADAFAKYPMGFTGQQKDDWRRNNVDIIIKQLHDTIKTIKPSVEFGISPFGVWRNKDRDINGSETKAGQTSYDDLYGDVLKWQKEGWIDYIVPQLYWYIGFEQADFKVLLDWWSRNTYGCPMYIGLAPYRIDKNSDNKPWRNANQIIKQLDLMEQYPNVEGAFYFSARTFKQNPLKLNEKLSKVYKYKALVPQNYRIRQISPEAPQQTFITVTNNEILLKWESGENTKSHVVYKFSKKEKPDMEDARNIYHISNDTSLRIPVSKNTHPDKYYYVITSLSPTNLESVPVYFAKK